MKKLLIIFVSAIALFILFNNVIMPLYVKHSDTVKVPKITGMNFIEAKKVIEDAGLEIKQGEVKYDESKQIGIILDQNPPSDETVKYGRRIYVTISGGEQLTDVPSLSGKSLRDAKFTLEQRGLKLGETVRKNSNEFPEDYVLSQVIQPGSKIKKNTSIDLILSDGPLIGDLKVPLLSGKTLEDAKKLITESKLKVGKITYQTNNNMPPGQIIDQYPKSDKSANENTTVDLFVSRKKAVVTQETEESETGLNTNQNPGRENENAKPSESTKDNTKTNPADTKTDKQTDKTQSGRKDDTPKSGTDNDTKKSNGSSNGK
ncbi:MAG: PASTA domain-containing protein [Ignavibacteria bacterium]|nr:PASTA domain-containing protein [Ignavibacteria bacterium]